MAEMQAEQLQIARIKPDFNQIPFRKWNHRNQRNPMVHVNYVEK